MKRNTWLVLVLVVVLSLVAACGSQATPAPKPAEKATEAPKTEEKKAEAAPAGDLKGKKVSIYGPFIDQDSRRFQASMNSYLVVCSNRDICGHVAHLHLVAG